MTPTILLVSNLMFIKMSSNNTFIKDVEDRYMTASVSGVLLNEVYTLSEIKTKYPNAKEVKDFLEVRTEYFK